MKRMLINATQPEELRVAMVDGQRLYDLDIETVAREQKKANIYKGRITRIEPSLEAAFVEYGSERHGFLPLKEVARSYFATAEQPGRASIKDALKEGQELVVQVEKEERGNKGAALTTFVSLAGRYLVLMPNNPRAGGVSRRVEGADRTDLRDAMSELEIPEGMGLIIRTAGVGRSVDELQWDLDYLLHLWAAIEHAARERKAPFLIYQESNLIIRALRDYLRPDIGEILIDDREIHRQSQVFVEQVMPHNLSKVKLYSDHTPLFNRFQIESQIESAFNREVRLPAGGAIVIDHTEALTTIDVNSSRATKGGDIEETALQTNLEAVDEIARQLRLRDTGGLIVIDFIDMTPARNQREVENRLKEVLKTDRARVQLGRISRFGLLEMSRQRLRPSLGESSLDVCPRCNGQGTVRSVESLALSVLRLVEEEAMKGNTAKIVAQLPVEVATFLLNDKRDAIYGIEQRHDVRLLLLPNPAYATPQYHVERIKGSESDEATEGASYKLIAAPEESEPTGPEAKRAQSEEPAVHMISPPSPAPARPSPATPDGPGFLARLFAKLFGTGDTADEKPRRERAEPRSRRADSTAKPQREEPRRRRTAQPGGRKPATRAKPPADGASKPRAAAQRRSRQGADQKPSAAAEGERPAATGPEAQGEAADQEARRSARRGRRGGRRRSARRSSAPGATDEAAGTSGERNSSKQERPEVQHGASGEAAAQTPSGRPAEPAPEVSPQGERKPPAPVTPAETQPEKRPGAPRPAPHVPAAPPTVTPAEPAFAPRPEFSPPPSRVEGTPPASGDVGSHPAAPRQVPTAPIAPAPIEPQAPAAPARETRPETPPPTPVTPARETRPETPPPTPVTPARERRPETPPPTPATPARETRPEYPPPAPAAPALETRQENPSPAPERQQSEERPPAAVPPQPRPATESPSLPPASPGLGVTPANRDGES